MSGATRGLSRTLWTQAAAVLGVALVTAALWAWASAAAWSQAAGRVDLALWAVRSLAVALAAAGQVLIALAVLPGVFGGGRGTLETRYAAFCGTACGVALAAGAILALLARW